MFDWLVETFSAYPYAGVALVFLACGLGLPMPEEIVLLFAGYLCYQGLADTSTMMAVAWRSLNSRSTSRWMSVQLRPVVGSSRM